MWSGVPLLELLSTNSLGTQVIYLPILSSAPVQHGDYCFHRSIKQTFNAFIFTLCPKKWIGIVGATQHSYTVFNIVLCVSCLQIIAALSPITWTAVLSSIVSKTWTQSPPTQSPFVQSTATQRDQKSLYLSSQVQNGSEVSHFISLDHDSSLDLNSSVQLCSPL